MIIKLGNNWCVELMVVDRFKSYDISLKEMQYSIPDIIECRSQATIQLMTAYTNNIMI